MERNTGLAVFQYLHRNGAVAKPKSSDSLQFIASFQSLVKLEKVKRVLKHAFSLIDSDLRQAPQPDHVVEPGFKSLRIRTVVQ